MKKKIVSLSKNEDFKSILGGKKISNKYLTIFFKKLSDKNNWYYAQQFENKANADIHEKTTAIEILNDFKDNIKNMEKQINDQNINYYVEYVVNQLFKANKYFNDQAPWTKKDDSLRLNTIVFVSLELIRKISILLYPIIPNTSLKVLNIFSMKEKDIKFDTISNSEYLKDKKKIIKLGILIEKIKK